MIESTDLPGIALAPPVIDGTKSITAETDVGRMFLRRDDETITPKLVQSGQLASDVAAFIRSSLRPGQSFVDVGAGVGYLSLLASSIVGAEGHVLALEPATDEVALLRANAWLHRAWNIRVLSVAAGADTGYATSAVRGADRSNAYRNDALVPVARLDELLSEMPVDLIRAEARALEGDVLDRLIEQHPGLVVICELSPAGGDREGKEPGTLIASYAARDLQIGRLAENGSVASVSVEQVIDECRSSDEELAKLVLTSTAKAGSSKRRQTQRVVTSGRWDPIFYEGWEQIVPPRSMWVGPGDPVAHFLRWPYEYLAYLTLLCDLKRDDSVLELGCNHGRTMLALLDYLRPPGRYAGFDILLPHIDYAREHIEASRSNFTFTHADIYNDAYNPTGKFDADDFHFPYEDASFNCAYAASLYTHLLPDATANYLRQTRRVLKDRGKCLYSFFILDFYGGAGTSAHPLYEFDGRLEGIGGVGVRDVQTPGAVIAYERNYLEQLAAAARLRVVKVIPGYWSAQSNYAVNEQDLVVLEAV